MIVFKIAATLQQHLASLKRNGKSVGFIPTMGALHQGHLSLIEASNKQCDITVCSIFINPTQFNDPKDFEKYPVTIEQDINLLTQHHTDILFLPAAGEIYPHGTVALPHYKLGIIETILEGKYRPNHFQGVCQVVDRLLQIVQPDTIFFGQKDYQQCMVIKKLIAVKKIPVAMHIHPTVREHDGLAMSSRNVRLSAEGREKATALYKALKYITANIFDKALPELQHTAITELLDAGFEKIDYITVADAETLAMFTKADTSTTAVVLAAAFIQGVRLIDNITLNA